MKRTLIILAAALSLFATSCTKWLDINKNPNYISEADMSLLLPSVQLRTAAKVGYDLSLYGTFWSQYVVQCNSTNQYYTIMTNDVTNSTFTSTWSYVYASIFPGIKEILAQCETKQNVSNFQLEAKAMLAYNLYLMTSLYDKVAYTEGFLTESQTPHFDTGESIQATLISLLEEIRAMSAATVAADEKLNPSSSSDMVFGGDTDAWFDFANTLYLKVLMRDFAANSGKIQSLLNEGNFLTEDASFDNFEDKADKSNPFYESDRRQLNTTANIRACSDILAVLSEDDPRLEYFYDQNPGGVFAGAAYGQNGEANKTSRLALYPTEAVYFGTVDEALFLQAEAYARLNKADAAEIAYDAAVVAAFKRVGVPAAAAALFLVDDYAFEAGTPEAMVEQIINQKWASNVHGMPWESWFDINRTGYPTRGKTITAFSGVLPAGQYPRRFIASKTSSDYNPNAPAPEEVSVKMWWQK